MLFYTCGPNEAMVISGMCSKFSPYFGLHCDLYNIVGCGHKTPRYIVGGRAIAIPCIQKVQKISVTTMTLVVESPRVYTQLGVPISVTGVAQVLF